MSKIDIKPQILLPSFNELITGIPGNKIECPSPLVTPLKQKPIDIQKPIMTNCKSASFVRYSTPPLSSTDCSEYGDQSRSSFTTPRTSNIIVGIPSPSTSVESGKHSHSFIPSINNAQIFTPYETQPMHEATTNCIFNYNSTVYIHPPSGIQSHYLPYPYNIETQSPIISTHPHSTCINTYTINNKYQYPYNKIHYPIYTQSNQQPNNYNSNFNSFPGNSSKVNNDGCAIRTELQSLKIDRILNNEHNDKKVTTIKPISNKRKSEDLLENNPTAFNKAPKRSHTCETCSRVFTTSGHLARHNRIHTGERKHMCPWPSCRAKFARQDNCMQHYKTHLKIKRKKIT